MGWGQIVEGCLVILYQQHSLCLFFVQPVLNIRLIILVLFTIRFVLFGPRTSPCYAANETVDFLGVAILESLDIGHLLSLLFQQFQDPAECPGVVNQV